MTSAPESTLQKFFRLESAGGILLMIAAVLAMLCANTSLSAYYDLLLSTPVEIRLGPLEIAKPLLLWINDGLMALFFFLIGLELKRELLEGELADRRNIILPGIGAIGGMLVPALVYLAFTAGDPVAQSGWAIPAATDIAFALGVLSLLGPRVPVALKLFLTSLAIFDDIGAIIIIAAFYTSKISFAALGVVAACLVILFLLNRFNRESKSLYFLVGAVMWVAMLKSGVHATLAGVALAMFIPLRSVNDTRYSPLKSLEHDLHPAVAFIILPLFAFVNAGIGLSGTGLEQVFHKVSLGITLGLFLGKQIGIFGACWLAIKLKMINLPDRFSWGSLYGVAILCGIGFTMSLFIGSLAFQDAGADRLFDERMGITAGSLISGLLGYFVLRRTLQRQ